MDVNAAEAAIVARILTISGASARSFPENPAEFVPKAHGIEHLVRYAGSSWDEASMTRSGVVIQEARHEFVVVSIYRHLTGHGGMYAHLTALQTKLTGYTIPSVAQATVLRPVRRSFIREDRGMWWYETVFAMTCLEAEG